MPEQTSQKSQGDMRARANCSQLSSNLLQIHAKLTFPGDLL